MQSGALGVCLLGHSSGDAPSHVYEARAGLGPGLLGQGARMPDSRRYPPFLTPRLTLALSPAQVGGVALLWGVLHLVQPTRSRHSEGDSYPYLPYPYLPYPYLPFPPSFGFLLFLNLRLPTTLLLALPYACPYPFALSDITLTPTPTLDPYPYIYGL